MGTEEGLETKTCSKCNRLRLLSDFYKDKKRKNGHYPYCRFCEARKRIQLAPEANEYFKQRRRTPQGRYNQMKGSAKYRGIECLLSFEAFAQLIQRNCFYCGGVLAEAGTGLDRLDNTKGYQEDNVVPCCTSCNKIKGDSLTVEEMQAVATLLKKMRSSKGELQ